MHLVALIWADERILEDMTLNEHCIVFFRSPFGTHSRKPTYSHGQPSYSQSSAVFNMNSLSTFFGWHCFFLLLMVVVMVAMVVGVSLFARLTDNFVGVAFWEMWRLERQRRRTPGLAWAVFGWRCFELRAASVAAVAAEKCPRCLSLYPLYTDHYGRTLPFYSLFNNMVMGQAEWYSFFSVVARQNDASEWEYGGEAEGILHLICDAEWEKRRRMEKRHANALVFRQPSVDILRFFSNSESIIHMHRCMRIRLCTYILGLFLICLTFVGMRLQRYTHAYSPVSRVKLPDRLKMHKIHCNISSVLLFMHVPEFIFVKPFRHDCVVHMHRSDCELINNRSLFNLIHSIGGRAMRAGMTTKLHYAICICYTANVSILSKYYPQIRIKQTK